MAYMKSFDRLIKNMLGVLKYTFKEIFYCKKKYYLTTLSCKFTQMKAHCFSF